MNVTGLHWWSVNIGSDNGLVPSDNKPLPEQMASLGINELITMTANGLTTEGAKTWAHFY